MPSLLWTVLTAGSLSWNILEARNGVESHMRLQGRDIFSIIEATRLWNAQHGGVYGLRSQASPSNPYLQAPEKDIATPDGRELTLLNPAYMTRQLSEVILDQVGVRIHITSLNPINPGNRAEAWESEALRGFELGQTEYFSVARQDDISLARYMGPLVTRQACLACHAHQGYQVGDIRGGISVSFNAQPYLSELKQRETSLTLVHLAIWLALVGITIMSARVMRRQFLQIRSARDDQDRLVQERTHELHREMSERKEAEAFLRMLLDASPEAMFGIDREGRCTYANTAARRLLGYADLSTMQGMDMLGQTLRDECARGTGTPSGLNKVLEQGDSITDQPARFLGADERSLEVEYSAQPIYTEGHLSGAVITFSDASHRLAQQKQLWHQATHDPLTNLPNRVLLNDRLASALAQAKREEMPFGLLFIDLDKFKQANDRYGHEAGDAILREAAVRMRTCLRETDTLARLGGDEFIALTARSVTAGYLQNIAARMLERLGLPFRVGEHNIEISASIGIALYPQDGDTLETLLNSADNAMYQAKKAGCNTWRMS